MSIFRNLFSLELPDTYSVNLKFRHEFKHFINYGDYLTISQALKLVCAKDPHVNSEGFYQVRSLYFDNFENKAVREKLNGLKVREKFRIRFYNQDASFIRLEKKLKVGDYCSKDLAKLTQDEAEKILAGEINSLDTSERKVLEELRLKMTFQQLRPKTVVEYQREPFVYTPGNVRITLDSRIHSSNYSIDLFNPELPLVSVSTPGHFILEVKFDEFLPEMIRDLIQTNTRRSSAISKYVAARIYS
ncbi:MAG: polyphosphate polymerase domain-containing protein [Clostridia bacterium]|nr:polyphosphate polymerase domain-containing protein [Clostridia bacterium]